MTDADSRELFEQNLTTSTQNLQTRILEKYKKGKTEHNSPLNSINAINEMEAEIIDLFVYLQILKHKLRYA